MLRGKDLNGIECLDLKWRCGWNVLWSRKRFDPDERIAGEIHHHASFVVEEDGALPGRSEHGTAFRWDQFDWAGARESG
jgi:hypothetical protein